MYLSGFNGSTSPETGSVNTRKKVDDPARSFRAISSGTGPPSTPTNISKVALVYNPYVNSGKTRTSGFDFDASGRFNTPLGQVRLKLEGEYTWKYQTWSVTDNAYTSNQAGNYDGGSRLNTKLRANIKSGQWDNGVAINYSSGYSSNSVASPTYCATQSVAALSATLSALVRKV